MLTMPCMEITIFFVLQALAHANECGYSNVVYGLCQG